MGEEIYRKQALQQLASVEQLDALLQVVPPKGWVALGAFGVLLLAAVVWGFTGSIPSAVEGQGILVSRGGVMQVSALGSGRVKDVYFEPGDLVEKGDIVARVDQPDLLGKVQTQRLSVAGLKARYSQTLEFDADEQRLQGLSLAQQRVDAEKTVEARRREIAWLQEELRGNEELLAQGLITKRDCQQTEREIESTEEQLRQAQNRLQQLALREAQEDDQTSKELTSLEQQINQGEAELLALERQLGALSTIVSPYSGRVVEVDTEHDVLIGAREPVLKLELVGPDAPGLEAVLFFPAMDGKRIELGMETHIAPTTIEQEEYGFVLGVVTGVSEFPVSREAIERTLANEDLVGMLMQGGPPIQIRVALIPDPRTHSGFRWSSSHGPPIHLQPGTTCTVQVVITEQRPISLIMPWLRKHLIGEGEEPA